MRLLAVLGMALSAASAQVPSATDITVRLASTQIVQSVTVNARDALMRTCASCPPQPLPTSLLVQQQGDHLHTASADIRELLVDGSATVTANGQQFSATGKWKIIPSSDGLHLTLTLPSERYVKAVLTAESSSEPLEALKAEAVVVRTFALMNLHRHALEGLCDNTHCQALRLGTVRPAISDAVDQTAGETLWFRGSRAETYFTQSCGGTSTTWPKLPQPWLVVHRDPYCERVGSAWRTTITERELRQALNAEGWHLNQPITRVSIITRDASGRALRLMVDQIAMDAPSFRFALDRQLGWNKLRSDMYTVHANNDGFVFDGKGFGHGVGLCQLGAAEMAREGTNYRQILAFYFPKTQVRIGPQDEGWREFSLGSLHVRATAPVQAAVPPGIDASMLRVTIYPTTELFRQATSQPGWMLGATQGTSIALQPTAVLERHGGTQRVLTHELMHAVIEQQSAPGTPLWLREGLAEYLASEPGAGTMRLAQIEHELQQPHSLAESQKAHLAAAARVQALVQQNGLPAVWNWVRSGHLPAMQ